MNSEFLEAKLKDLRSCCREHQEAIDRAEYQLAARNRSAADKIEQEIITAWKAKVTLVEPDDTPLSDEYFAADSRWSVGTLFYTMLLPAVNDGAIVELCVKPSSADDGTWDISMQQGLPAGDDQHVADDHILLTSLSLRTVKQLERLISGLKGE